jgi:hypothetical protein
MASLRELLAAKEAPKKKLLLSDPSASSLPISDNPQVAIARLLGQTTADVPYDFPKSDDPFPRQLIHRIMHAEAAQLGIALDQENPSLAWIAIRLSANDLALLHPLPILLPSPN